MTYTAEEKRILTNHNERRQQIIFSMTRGNYRKNLEAVIRRALIHDLEQLNDEDGSYDATIQGIKDGNQEAIDAALDGVTAIYLDELNITVNF